MTLAQLSAVSEVSVGLLSRLENGNGNPSLGTLAAIARALEVDLHDLLEGRDQPTGQVVRDQRRLEIHAPAVGGVIRAVDLGTRGDLAVYTWRLPRSFSGQALHHAHSGDEFHLVLRGRVRFHVAEEVHELDPGDSIVFDASRDHWVRNVGAGTSELFTVTSPPHLALQVLDPPTPTPPG
jgi:mannose-6-phosphate isomerase-like protein (cupin superfamily)/DNA-binding Xre family transcriptional regulator